MSTTLASSIPWSEQAVGKGFGIRALAWILDEIIFSVTFLVVVFLIAFAGAIVMILGGQEPVLNEQPTQFYERILGFFISTAYFVVFEWLYGATPGKLLLGMRVVKESGEPCGFKAALIRGLLRYVDLFFFGIPALFSMHEPWQQRIGDKAAHTIVVSSKEPRNQMQRQWWWLLVAAGIILVIDAILGVIFFLGSIS